MPVVETKVWLSELLKTDSDFSMRRQTYLERRPLSKHRKGSLQKTTERRVTQDIREKNQT